MLMSIPIIAPIEINLPPSGIKQLPSPDQSGIEEAEYTVDESTPVAPATAYLVATPAMIALNQIEQAAEVSQYHDFGWWRQRISTIRSALKQTETFKRES